ncbi:helix-turn-helix domain-containing protein [Rhizobium sp. SGZ-381]|uniref:helix-turn-helix domain-containing protein n=1 Tax=Rhizobium sp. SGZ-381 TaxID=3342800 RepID=UPI003671E4B6
MSNVTKIHSGKTPVRIHFIPEWAEHRHLRQADIASELDVDKSLVSRWFKGVNPKDEYLEALSHLFGTDINGLYRHPDDDWLAKFFRDKTEEQKERAINMLKLMFEATKTGTRD